MSRRSGKTPYWLFPVPVVLVTSVHGNQKPNIITIAWTGALSSSPPLVYISMKPTHRHSYQLIKDSGEYVINIPTADIIKEVDYCGVISGEDVDKFAATGFSPLPASIVKAPLIKECPVNLECVVKQTVEVGSNHMFIGEIVAIRVDDQVLGEDGDLNLDRFKGVGYCGGEYRLVGPMIGQHGFSKKKLP